jgi:hypothetical protein
MTVDPKEILQDVLRFYLDSGDFNGCPVATLTSPDRPPIDLRSAIETLVRARRVDVLTPNNCENTHIKRFPPPPIEKQIKDFGSTTDSYHVCLYPHPDVLKEHVDHARFDGRPFELELALGAEQLAYRAFDLTVLEFYRSDPRYHYSCDEIHGSISIGNDYYRSPNVPERDQVLLETFGFAYNENLDRAVTTFVRYLAKLTAEHQQIWKAKQLGPEFKMHPDFYRSQILGEWPNQLPIFTAFWMELELINRIAVAMGRPLLFRDTSIRPRNFAFLIRPTAAEFNDFILTLDKVISDNINREFFEGQLALEEEEARADGRIVVRQKGTLVLLEEWLRKGFRTRDWTPLEDAMAAFKKIRKLRQQPAHALRDDVFDQKYFHQQRELFVRAYDGVRVLRMAFERHPAASGIEVDEFLRDGKISEY